MVHALFMKFIAQKKYVPKNMECETKVGSNQIFVPYQRSHATTIPFCFIALFSHEFIAVDGNAV